MNKLSGKVAVVTGASKGIGASIAEHIAAEGAAVVVNYSSSKAGADAVVARIAAKGGRAIAAQADVSKPEDVVKLFGAVKDAFGRVDILVNNAGIYKFARLEEITPEHFHEHFNLNVLGLLLCTQEAVKLMGPGGAILNISSIVGQMPAPTAAVYSASKAGVDAITVSLSKELGPRKIRVNSINPGVTLTEGVNTRGLDQGDFRKKVEADTPLGRVAEPHEIAKAAVFFVSDDAGWVTGQTLIVAGGQRM